MEPWMYEGIRRMWLPWDLYSSEIRRRDDGVGVGIWRLVHVSCTKRLNS